MLTRAGILRLSEGRERVIDRTGLVLPLCLLVWIALGARADALTKILVVPTARTMGARRYAFDLNRKGPLFDSPERNLDVTGKVGLGERVQLEAKLPFASSNDSVLFFGKYSFALSRRMTTAAALGFENLGSGSRTVPYVAVSHLYEPVDLTVGTARGAESRMVWFTGLDYLIGKLHVLADYNTGPDTFAALGYQYDFSEEWSVKSGLQARHDERADVLIKVSYSGRY